MVWQIRWAYSVATRESNKTTETQVGHARWFRQVSSVRWVKQEIRVGQIHQVRQARHSKHVSQQDN